MWKGATILMALSLAGCPLARAQTTTTLPADAGNAASADGEAQPLSLAEAKRIALGKNWDLLASAAGVDAATAQRIVAHEFPNPTLSVSSSAINVDNRLSSTSAGNGLWDRSYDTILAVNQLFEIGGKRRSRQASAQAAFEEAKAEFLDAERTLDLGVTRAYAAAALAEESARVLRESAGILREEARIAEVRFKSGEISSSDKSQIEITTERFELDARAAESSAARARVALEVLLGVPLPKGDVVLTERLEALVDSGAGLNPNSTVARRPDVVAADAALRKAEADLRLQKANRIPDPTVVAEYEHQPPDRPNTVGFGVSIPLPLWNRNRGNILAADAAREKARLDLERTRAQASAEVATALLAYGDAVKRWQSFRDSIRPRSEQVRKTKAYAYEKGGASLLDMLVAERDDNEVRLAAIQAASDAVVAIAALQAATLELRPSELKR